MTICNTKAKSLVVICSNKHKKKNIIQKKKAQTPSHVWNRQQEPEVPQEDDKWKWVRTLVSATIHAVEICLFSVMWPILKYVPITSWEAYETMAGRILACNLEKCCLA